MSDTEIETTPAPAATETAAEPAAAAPAKPDSAPQSEEAMLSSIYRKAMDGGDGDPAEAQVESASEGALERDAMGRFVAKTQPEGEAAAEGEPAPDETATEVPPAEIKASGGEFRGWSPEERAAFGKLPKEAQDFVLARQTATANFYQGKVAELTNYAKQNGPMFDAIGQHGEYLSSVTHALGIPAEQVLSNLMHTESTLRFGSFDQKAAVLMGMAKDYGIPMQLVSDDPLADPIAPGGERYKDIHDLRQQNAVLQSRLDALDRRGAETSHHQVQSTIQQFAEARDEAGEPRYPHFDLVRHKMGELIDGGHARGLEDAYQQATAPIRHAVTHAAAAKSHAAEAKRAGKLNVTTAPRSVERYVSEEEALSAAYRSAMAN